MPLTALALPLILSTLAAESRQSATRLYVANSAGNDIHIIDTASNRVIKRIEVGPEPHGLVATPSGDRIFITIENTRGDHGELLWFDPVSDTVKRRLAVGPRPNQLAVTPDGSIAYIPCDDATWWVVDTLKGELIKKIPTGGRPHNTLCSPDGRWMYLGPKGSYHVLIADTVTHQLVGEIPLSDAPRPIALSKDGTRLFANVDTLIGFEVADVARRKVLHRVEAVVPEELLRKASRSHGIGLRPGEKELWMCDVYHDRTYVFDLTAEPPRQVATIVMKGGGYWMAFSPDGTRCYISERVGNTVAVIDTDTRETIARIAVGNGPKRVMVAALPASEPVARKVIAASEARDHLGETCTVEMTVRLSKNAASRREYYLDSEEDFHDEKNLALVISYDHDDRFKQAGIHDPSIYYKGKAIRVTGKVIDERDQVRIRVEDPKQIELVAPGETKSRSARGQGHDLP